MVPDGCFLAEHNQDRVTHNPISTQLRVRYGSVTNPTWSAAASMLSTPRVRQAKNGRGTYASCTGCGWCDCTR
jgi:hypothetical protein